MFTLAHIEYDGWKIHLTPLHGLTGEICDPPTRTFLIDPTGSTLELAAAHAIAHLTLRHHLAAPVDFSSEHCDEADEEAERVLRMCAWRLEKTSVPMLAKF